MSSEYSSAVSTAREYYNSEDADNFYFAIWGGEDIHIGLYDSGAEPFVLGLVMVRVVENKIAYWRVENVAGQGTGGAR